MAFDYDKLLGLMREKKVTQQELAKQIGNTTATLNLKLNNKAKFRQTEIIKICEVLGISEQDIVLYFFTQQV